jgi:hypothetical protein
MKILKGVIRFLRLKNLYLDKYLPVLLYHFYAQNNVIKELNKKKLGRNPRSDRDL